MQKIDHGIGQGFTAQQIGPVREDFNVQRRFIAGVNVGPKQGKLLVDLLNVMVETSLFNKGLEKRLWDGNCGHNASPRKPLWKGPFITR